MRDPDFPSREVQGHRELHHASPLTDRTWNWEWGKMKSYCKNLKFTSLKLTTDIFFSPKTEKLRKSVRFSVRMVENIKWDNLQNNCHIKMVDVSSVAAYSYMVNQWYILAHTLLFTCQAVFVHILYGFGLLLPWLLKFPLCVFLNAVLKFLKSQLKDERVYSGLQFKASIHRDREECSWSHSISQATKRDDVGRQPLT